VLQHFLFGLKSNYCGIDPAYRASPTSQCTAHSCRTIAIKVRRDKPAGSRECKILTSKEYDPLGPEFCAGYREVHGEA